MLLLRLLLQLLRKSGGVQELRRLRVIWLLLVLLLRLRSWGLGKARARETPSRGQHTGAVRSRTVQALSAAMLLLLLVEELLLLLLLLGVSVTRVLLSAMEICAAGCRAAPRGLLLRAGVLYLRSMPSRVLLLRLLLLLVLLGIGVV